MRSKTQLIKTASTLKEFSTKIKSEQDGEVLTPETVKEISQEIAEVASVAAELANEIVEGVPSEEGTDSILDREEGPKQIEVAMDKTDEEKEKNAMDKKHGMKHTAMDKKHGMDDDDDVKEKLATMTKELLGLKREAALAKLAPKYASLFPKNMHEAKLSEITTSKEPLNVVEAKIQEASSIISNKTMIKIASQSDSIYDVTDGDEINISTYV